MKIRTAITEDLEMILQVQKLAFQSEADLYNNCNIDPMVESMYDLKKDFSNPNKNIFAAIINNQVIGSVRTYTNNSNCQIQKLSVHPNFRRKGIGRNLVEQAELEQCNVERFTLFTGEKSEINISFYKKLGYSITNTQLYPDGVHMVYMEKESKKKELLI